MSDNPALATLRGLDTLETIDGSLYLLASSVMSAMVDIIGLDALESVGGTVAIRNNPALTQVSGLSKLLLVGGSLVVQGNPLLLDLDGLAAVATVGGPVAISNNDRLCWMLREVIDASYFEAKGLGLVSSNRIVVGQGCATRRCADSSPCQNGATCVPDGLNP